MFLTLILIFIVILIVLMVIKRMFKPCADCVARKRFDFAATSNASPEGEHADHDDDDFLSDSD